jgi:hypothetical protein
MFLPPQKNMRALATRAQAASNLARLLREFPTAASRSATIAVVEVGHGIVDAYLGLKSLSSATRSRVMHSAKRMRTGTLLVLHPDVIHGAFDTRFHGAALSIEIVGFRPPERL